VTRLGIDDRKIAVRLSAGTNASLISKTFSHAMGPTQAFIQRISGKQAATGVIPSYTPSAEAKNQWNYTYAPHIRHSLQGGINLYKTFKSWWLIYLPHLAHMVYLCIQYDSDIKYPFSAKSIRRLIFLMEAHCVLCEVKKKYNVD